MRRIRAGFIAPAPAPALAVLVAAFVLLGALGVACSGKLPSLGSPAACGNQCDVMSCPSGMACVLDSSCAARCAPIDVR